jgi:hypothetical protein
MSEERYGGIFILILAVLLTPMMVLFAVPWYGLVRSPIDFWFNVASDFAIGGVLITMWVVGIRFIWKG